MCASDALPEGGGRNIKLVPGKEAYVFRLAGAVRAFINRCTHMGGPVELTPKKDQLCCRWHHGTFDPDTGERTGGQPPEQSKLDRVEVSEDTDGVWLAWSIPPDPFSL